MRKGAIKKVAKYVHRINDIIEDLNEIISNEQAYFDERSDEWREGEKGEEFSDRIYQVEGLRDALENTTYEIGDLISEYDDD